MRPEITLLYDKDCPNVDLARDNLRRAMDALSLPAEWQEVDIADIRTPRRLKVLGSPAVLVNGKDLGGSADNSGACCRLYEAADGGLLRAPGVEAIVGAIRAAGQRVPSRWRLSAIRHALTSLPGAGAAMLPVGVCPACLPADLGLLSMLGLGFLLPTKYLLPLTAGLLALALAGLGYKASRRRGYWPLCMGVAGGGLILAGKFLLATTWVVYAGVGLLLTASIWNAWPRKAARTTTCRLCVPTGNADLPPHA
jgi:hypothetical protein